VYSQPYSKWVEEWVGSKLQNEALDGRAYAMTYQAMSDNISKTIMIINVPMIAAFLYLLCFKKRRFYYDRLIFTLHFFSVFLASWIMLAWIDPILTFLAGHDNSFVSEIFFYLFVFFIPLLFAILSIKRFLGLRWYWAFPAGLLVILAVNLSNLLYRFIIFILTFWVT